MENQTTVIQSTLQTVTRDSSMLSRRSALRNGISLTFLAERERMLGVILKRTALLRYGVIVPTTNSSIISAKRNGLVAI